MLVIAQFNETISLAQAISSYPYLTWWQCAAQTLIDKKIKKLYWKKKNKVQAFFFTNEDLKDQMLLSKVHV